MRVYNAKTAIILCSVLAGCDALLEVELPTRVPAEALDDPAMAAVLVGGAVADFECAYANYVAATALLTDELIISTEFIAPTSWDLRSITADNGNLGTAGCNAFGFGLFQPLSTARFQADDAHSRIEAFPDADVPGKGALLASASAHSGYGLTLLGEAFCRAAVDQSAALQPRDVLAMAEQRFDVAVQEAQSAGDQDILGMARVGRARVRLDLGDMAGAASDAREVPEGFVKMSTYSGANARRENTLWVYNHRDIMVSVDPRFRGLVVDGMPDSRVPVRDGGRVGHDGLTALWLQLKYPQVGSPIRLASWEEAQLIIAEAEGGESAVEAINNVRALYDLPPFTGSAPDEIQTEVLEARKRGLYLEGHRLNDMLRHGLEFDSGLNHKGVPYGSTTCLPLPEAEVLSNPNISS